MYRLEIIINENCFQFKFIFIYNKIQAGRRSRVRSLGNAMSNEMDQFVGFIRGSGFKLTPQRRRVAEAVLGLPGQFTTGQLYALMRKRRPLIGRSTVYRTLEHLVGSGVVVELNARGGAAFYECVSGRLHHSQLLCLMCGRGEGEAFKDFGFARFEGAIEERCRELGWELKYYVLGGRGVCRACRQARERGYKFWRDARPASRPGVGVFPAKEPSFT